MPGRRVTRREHPGRLDHHLDAVVAPRDLGRVAFFELLDLLAVDRESAVADLDLVAVLGESTSVDDVNDAFAAATNDASYRGVLTYTDEPLVSADIVGNPASCIFSAKDTMVNGTMVKVLGWYDNEWGFSNRLIDLSAFLGER